MKSRKTKPKHTQADLLARITYAASITCPALRNICEDNHPDTGFDRECAWCQIERALDLRRWSWRVRGE